MGKGSKPVVGFWYRVAWHHGLTIGPIDAFLEFRGGDKTAWSGELTASGTITVTAPNLWGGEKDQGGIVGDLDVMFGDPSQMPNSYLVSVFGNQTAAWRGFATVAFKGGKYGAMNPYRQKPSYKFRRIVNGWDDDDCWYPEKAEISTSRFIDSRNVPAWRYKVVSRTDATDYSSPSFDDSAWPLGQAPFASFHDMDSSYWDGVAAHGFYTTPGTNVPQAVSVWMRGTLNVSAPTRPVTFRAWVDNGIQFYVNGVKVIDDYGTYGHYLEQVLPPGTFVTGTNAIAVRGTDDNVTGSGGWFYFDFAIDEQVGVTACNPAHVLYESRTTGDMGREPRANINDASLRAAADKLYNEGFGICPKWDPASESVEDFEQRICKLIGGSFTRSLVDGQWYLDLARGDYVLDELPVLTDDDILSFKEQPSILDNAVNSVSVRYFDPVKKETIVTPPVRALGLVMAFGTIHQTNDYPEIPTATLATQIAQRDLLASVTPTRAFDLVTTRRTYAWRRGQYFRLQTPKRGITDMVCIVGQIESGTLKSGAIKLKATQAIYSLPRVRFAQVEPGVDTRPLQTPTAITLQRAIEAPYINVASTLPAASLAALSPEAGYMLAVAADPATSRNYTLMSAAGGGPYVEVGDGEWCPSALIAEGDEAGRVFTLASGTRLDRVAVGSAALWDDEIVRVDALDIEAGTITLGRGCADTVAQLHAAGSRIWFYDGNAAADTTEYVEGETINAKLLTNTGSAQLELADATALAVEMQGRAARPYPPGNLLIDEVPYPAEVEGTFSVTWAHRNRVTQADQLLDATAASVTPATNTRYGLRFLDDDAAELISRTDIGPGEATVALNYTGNVTMELWTIDDTAESLQRHRVAFAYTPPAGVSESSIDATAYTPVFDGTIVDGGA